LSRKSLLIGSVLFLGTLSAFVSLTCDAIVHGDAAIYALQIEQRDLAVRTIHLGYYLLGILFHAILGGSIGRALNLMGCFFGAGSVLLTYGVTLRLSKSQIGAVVAALLFATHQLLAYYALFAEVYVVQVFFLLLLFALWVRGQWVVAGIVFGMAILITPASLLFLPVLIVIRPRLRGLLTVSLIGLGIAAVMIVPRYEDYLFGERGLLGALSGREIGLIEVVEKEVFELFEGVFLWLAFLLVGFIHVIRRKELRSIGLGLMAGWLGTLLVGERFWDVPAQLPLHALLCALAGIGFVSLQTESSGSIRRSIVLFVYSSAPLLLLLAKGASDLAPYVSDVDLGFRFVGYRFLSVFAIGYLITGWAIRSFLPKQVRRTTVLLLALALPVTVNTYRIAVEMRSVGRAADAYRDTVIDLGNDARSGYRVVGDWSRGILYEYYVLGCFYTEQWINTEWLNGQWGSNWKVKAEEAWIEAIERGREIWFVSRDAERLCILQEAGYGIEEFGSVLRARPSEKP